VNTLGVIALCDGALAVLMAVEWRGLLARRHRDTGWRSRASLVGFGMATVVLLLELVIAGAALRYGSLGALDEASQQGGTSAALAIVVLCSLVAAGILSLGAVILTLVGTGPRRASTVVCSAAVLLGFVVMLVVAINSFH
jgi:hypothetical protein